MVDVDHSIKVDLIDFVSSRTIGRRTVEITRGALVYGITDGEPSERQQLALDQTDVPQDGDPHPDLESIFVDERRVTAIGPNQFFITIIYRAPLGELVQIMPNRGNGVLDTELTSLDKNGALIETTLGGEPQDHQIPILRPKLDLEYIVHTHLGGTTDMPWITAANAIGTINDSAFNLAGLGDDTEKWLLIAMDFEIFQEYAVDVGEPGTAPLWRLRYVFRYDVRGWKRKVYHRESASDTIRGSASVEVDVYDLYDFNTLPGLS